MNKKHFIEKILNSIEGIEKAMPNDDLFYKIQNKIEVKKESSNYTKWLVAASIVILLSLNAFEVFYKSKVNKNDLSVLIDKNNNQIY
ncbi:MAG: hypothetical protein QM535_04705 [Limnohabitans sp.]|nr:hypothetical protein [Limnohabitans sp.]